MKQVLLVFLGGGIGSALRYLVGSWLNNPQNGIPYGTFVANILGSLIIGAILGWALKNNTLGSGAVLILATGFCGGFTTFSTFAYENHLLLRSGDFFNFALYTISSILLGFAAVFLGIWLARYI
ncbi:fluoride efflux transporter CrcB [Leeuwenhoekiella sp. A16]|uniref:fluoride efflux transporter CrcB n=1 Tax=unclassified Leeuwenhoekiella TaxID=2615029 RepID=UPI003A804893|tara:strand:- start:819 stop:1190 length:372 start_codon:yes stop_codon:yes gene_type:complete